VFGFRDVTAIPQGRVIQVKGHAQISAPLLYAQQGQEVIVGVTNVGLQQRPDLTDGHTLHWHGFRNAIPYYDGVPEMSLSVPIGRTLRYAYRPHDPGTYMYHCHFEDVEHVQMGMTGIVFVRPGQDRLPASARPYPGTRFAYNDGDGSTRFDREFALLLTEMWVESHYKDAHIQQPDWSEYKADLWLMNGRSYPDTLAPGGDPLVAPADPRLRFNPISSLIRCNGGDRVLLRFASLGYQSHSMTLPGIPMRVVGRDATLLRGRDDTDLSYSTETIDISPGESYDAIFVAPENTTGEIQKYLLYDRDLVNRYQGTATTGGLLSTDAGTPVGQITEVHVYPTTNPRPPQTRPNT
jgi:FtsP/CotA-like multicopper oxidase with cupredoxin domain